MDTSSLKYTYRHDVDSPYSSLNRSILTVYNSNVVRPGYTEVCTSEKIANYWVNLFGN